jgi:hypothetical protein
MNRLLLFGAIAAAMLALPAAALGTVTRTVIHYDGTGSDLQHCSGEPMSLLGDIVITRHEDTDAAGGVHVTEHVVFQDLTATGLITGDRYRFVNAGNGTFNTTQGAATMVVSGATLQVGPGPDDSLTTILELSITNANGELVVFDARWKSICR